MGRLFILVLLSQVEQGQASAREWAAVNCNASAVCCTGVNGKCVHDVQVIDGGVGVPSAEPPCRKFIGRPFNWAELAKRTTGATARAGLTARESCLALT